MKKTIVVLLLSLSLLNFTCITVFSESQQPQIMTLVEELKSISESIDLNMRSLIGNKYDKNDMMKQLQFLSTRLNDVLLETNKKENLKDNNLLKRREYITASTIASTYLLAVNSMMLSVENENNYEYVLDAAQEIQNGDYILNSLASKIK